MLCFLASSNTEHQVFFYQEKLLPVSTKYHKVIQSKPLTYSRAILVNQKHLLSISFTHNSQIKPTKFRSKQSPKFSSAFSSAQNKLLSTQQTTFIIIHFTNQIKIKIGTLIGKRLPFETCNIQDQSTKSHRRLYLSSRDSVQLPKWSS